MLCDYAKFVVIALCVLISWGMGVSGAYGANAPVKITLDPPPKESLVGGPVPVTLTILNVSGAEVKLDLSYPDMMQIAFSTSEPDVITKPNREASGFRYIPVQLPGGGAYVAHVFLNHYFTFKAPGKIRVEYEINLRVTTTQRAETVNKKGAFDVSLIKGTEDALKQELGSEVKQLKSPDRQKQLEAVEAICYIENPIAIPFVEQVLETDDHALMAVQALARLDGLDSHKGLIRALSNREQAVVATALNALLADKVVLEQTAILPLVRSENAGIRLAAVEYIAKVNHPLKDELLRGLESDPNPAVAAAVKKAQG